MRVDRQKRNRVIDAALLLGFLGTFFLGLTGLAISSWLAIPLGSYAAWRSVHVAASVVTLLVVVAKVGLHWRWVFASAQRLLPPALSRRLARWLRAGAGSWC